MNDLKSNTWNSFFENIILGIHHTVFLYSPTRSSGYRQRLFLISDFLAESLKSNKNCKKDDSLYDTVGLNNLTHLTNMISIDIENNMLLQQSQKLS